jgi:hypothetical protein
MEREVEEQTVVLVTAPLAFSAAFLPIQRALEGRPVPRHVRLLSSHQPPLHMNRPDDRTLVVRPSGGFLKNPFEQLARGPGYEFKLGDCVALPGLIAEVGQLTADGRPAEVSFRFSVPLEDVSLRWLAWTGRDYAEFSPPPIGTTVVLPKDMQGQSTKLLR